MSRQRPAHAGDAVTGTTAVVHEMSAACRDARAATRSARIAGRTTVDRRLARQLPTVGRAQLLGGQAHRGFVRNVATAAIDADWTEANAALTSSPLVAAGQRLRCQHRARRNQQAEDQPKTRRALPAPGGLAQRGSIEVTTWAAAPLRGAERSVVGHCIVPCADAAHGTSATRSPVFCRRGSGEPHETGTLRPFQPLPDHSHLNSGGPYTWQAQACTIIRRRVRHAGIRLPDLSRSSNEFRQGRPGPSSLRSPCCAGSAIRD